MRDVGVSVVNDHHLFSYSSVFSIFENGFSISIGDRNFILDH